MEYLMVDLIGFFGNLFLSLCGIPLLSDTIKGKSFTSYKFLFVWLIGEILAIIAGIIKAIPWFITANYMVSIVLILLIFFFQYRNSKKTP